MGDTTEGLRRKMVSAGELRSVVRTMKALAASSIGQYERSVLALADYDRTVEAALGAAFRAATAGPSLPATTHVQEAPGTTAIIFGTDQGLVGQFNDSVADFALKTLGTLAGRPQVWAVGERVHNLLVDAGLEVKGSFPVPNSVEAITGLVGELQIECEANRAEGDRTVEYVFHNRPTVGGLYEPVAVRLLPLDATWQEGLVRIPWATALPPEVLGDVTGVLRALIREYLFISLFQACAESLASENASRLAAMQRADRNIDDLLETLNHTFNSLRQSRIDEELFDVVSGFEALTGKRHGPGPGSLAT
jgi:F-type H+-transporting ATPase subunit gamma